MSLLFSRPGFKVVQGDILQDRADILVVPVNCVPGVIGAGLREAIRGRLPRPRSGTPTSAARSGLRPWCCRCMVFNVGPKPLERSSRRSGTATERYIPTSGVG